MTQRSVVDHLLELVRIPSVSSLSNSAVVEYAISALDDMRWRTLALPYHDASGSEKINLVAAPPGQDPETPADGLVLVCHTDTVPYAADWERALQPFLADEMVHGCGACDVKGFLACLLAAAGEEASLHRDLRIILTADEEVGCIGAQQLLAADLLHPRWMIVGEPTSLVPARAGKGYCLGEVTIFGAEAHSAHPAKGRSAIYDAARMIAEVELLAKRLTEAHNDFFDPAFLTINIGTVRGGTAKNVVPGECRFLIEWRPLPGSVDEVPKDILQIGERLKRADPGFRFEWKILRQQAGFETSSDSELVRTLERLTQQAASSIPFGSEASVFASVAKEIVVFGPGDMRTAHSPRECVSVSELHKAVSVIERLIHATG